MSDLDWTKYPNFRKKEFDCSHTGRNQMQAPFMDLLQLIRTEIDIPLYISSGYRDPTHPIEVRKARSGEHTYGLACDVAIYGANAVKLTRVALSLGMKRIGIKQNGPMSSRFIHLGLAGDDLGFSSPWMWSY